MIGPAKRGMLWYAEAKGCDGGIFGNWGRKGVLRWHRGLHTELGKVCARQVLISSASQFSVVVTVLRSAPGAHEFQDYGIYPRGETGGQWAH